MGFVTAIYNKKTRNVRCDIPLTVDMVAILKLIHDNANDKRQFVANCEIEGINPLNYIVEETPQFVTIKADVTYYETMIKVMPLIESINEKLAVHLGKDFAEFWKQDYTLKIKAKPKAAPPSAKKKTKFFIESVDKDGVTPIYWASKDGWVSESDGIDKTLYSTEKAANKVVLTKTDHPTKISSISV